MNYAELIATAYLKATGASDSLLPLFKQIVLDAAVKSGHKRKELLEELLPQHAETLLAELLQDKEALVAMVDATLPPGTPSITAQVAMLNQIEDAKAAMQKSPVVPLPLPKPKWAPLRMFQRRKD